MKKQLISLSNLDTNDCKMTSGGTNCFCYNGPIITKQDEFVNKFNCKYFCCVTIQTEKKLDFSYEYYGNYEAGDFIKEGC